MVTLETQAELAARALAAARQAGDRRAEASALTDLGAIAMTAGDLRRAAVLLDEALGVANASGDRSLASGALSELGLLIQHTGQPARARSVLESALALARASGDTFAAKTALDRLGMAAAALRDFEGASALYEQALALAREAGDQQHQYLLHWRLAIVRAELNQHARASAEAQAAVALLEAMGRPEARWYAAHLAGYLGNGSLAAAPDRGALDFGGVIDASGALSQAGPEAPRARGPGLLQMALTASKAMAQFLGGGLRTVPDEMFRLRIETCATCSQHTGVRCRVCGCFTGVKARLPHESCPIGKWPA